MKSLNDILLEEDLGNVYVTPETIFQFDENEFTSYRELRVYLNSILNTKADLITLLHFGTLEEKNSGIFLEQAGLKIENLRNLSKFDENIKKIQSQYKYEEVEGEGKLYDAYNEKNIYRVDFKPFTLESASNQDKQIPRKEKAQIKYLKELIDQGFFNVVDNYNDRKRKLNQLFYQLAQFNCWGQYNSLYNDWYRNRVLIEAFERKELSDFVLNSIISSWLDQSSLQMTDGDIMTFVKRIRNTHPELAQKILDAAKKHISDTPHRHWEKKYKNNWNLAKGEEKEE